ncbi:MAG TPA: MoxR family ATPase [Candidatus Bathyarchaeia archaeon]|nr:MoxR family ATPase [Candidatus Bathyarchaeia archaeon]
MSVSRPVKLTREEVHAGLVRLRYLTTPRVEMAIFLAVNLEKPLLAEGPAGAGKTEIAKVLAALLGTELVRLQCYEGLDEARALYEWNYQKQLLRIQSDQAEQRGWAQVSEHIFSREYLLERPLLRAISAQERVVLLIDEIDKADEEFEAFLLEVLSDFQVSIPELGTITARERPIVVLTSNRARELSEALRRRCLHVYVDFPGPSIEAEIVRQKVEGLDEALAGHVARLVSGLRKLELRKAPSIAETLDWARALVALGVKEIDAAAVRSTVSLLLKHEDDVRRAEGKLGSLVASTR